jgi:hypothetical protein
MPTLETTLDLARIKLEKARLDKETEHQQAEDAMKVTEEYCDSIVMYEGEQTLTSHGLDNIQNNKMNSWNEHNNTIQSLKDERKNEIRRKIQLAQLEVDLHKKLKFLSTGCPSVVQNLKEDALPSSTPEGSKRIPTSERCNECGGVHRRGVPELGESSARMYCAWKNHVCYEIEFLTGKCSPPDGMQSKCYRSNLLDPDVVKAVDAFQATEEVDLKIAKKKKMQLEERISQEAKKKEELENPPVIKAPKVITGAKVGTVELRKYVEKTSEYAGKHFVPKIRKMLSRNDKNLKQYYGEASSEDAKKIIEEGIPLTKLPSK